MIRELRKHPDRVVCKACVTTQHCLRKQGSRGDPMITNDQELQVTQERIMHFQRWLADLRQTARPEDFEAISNGYRLEIERMQVEVLEYLLRPITAEVERKPPGD
jgi:hypothetical protein